MAAAVFEFAGRARRWSTPYVGGVGIGGFAVTPAPRTPHRLPISEIVAVAGLFGVADIGAVVSDVLIFDREFERLKAEDALADLRALNAG